MNKEQAIDGLRDKNNWTVWKSIRGKSESIHPNLITNTETKVMQFLNKTFGFGIARIYLQLIAGEEGQRKLNNLLETIEN